jgi:hypothetical protein
MNTRASLAVAASVRSVEPWPTSPAGSGLHAGLANVWVRANHST